MRNRDQFGKCGELSVDRILIDCAGAVLDELEAMCRVSAH
jgi:hypothetical protein